MDFAVLSKGGIEAILEKAGDKLVVVYFYDKWSGPCTGFYAEILRLYEELKSEFLLVTVDIESTKEIATQHNVTELPTFIFIKNQQKLEEFCGADDDKVIELINRHK